ncbi:probable G-protein coupled receptor 82 [Hypanus sabinus]|uniref:probable G-protein coupled receptor 82 n=1 Tax=Hypanus sabinus TaxID=79690 RepID=UPI0028C38F49|nr:probable G-protein coupled receptor 82 [Hypanus sabinus]XP_059849990.1 probable G-protein coupled receptor 82 [Hypanus sabinus]XP_059849991.1 probable G-protein coupled receptor 82 [Hypanus sabinus]
MNNSTRMLPHMCNYTAGPLEKGMLPIMYTVISFTGILANFWILLIFQKQFLKKSGVRIYLMNLSVADLIICLVLPFRVALLIKGDTWEENSDKCIAVNIIINLCFYCTLACRTLCLIFIGFTRYAVIVKFQNKKFDLLYRLTFAKCACTAFWIVGTLLVLTCSIYALQSMKVSMSRCYSVQVYNDLQPNLVALIVISILFLIILMPLVILYILVMIYLFEVSKNSSVQRSRKLYKKTQLRICVAVSTCVVCVLPYISYQFISNIYRVTQNECHVLVKMQEAKQILLLLVSFNSCLDPILYIIIQKYFSVVNWNLDPQTIGKSLDRETVSNTH